MPRNSKPEYVDPGRKEAISFKPPFLFRNVTARVFPLKANMARLTQFCDQYLNMDIPPEIVHFTPALPYVYFTALNYGRMSAASLQAQGLGWVAQHEVCFTVVLQQWRKIHGKLKFQDWATVSPFIFVDAPMSQTTGRDVYGWPKVLARIEPHTPLWATHPRSPTRLFTMSTKMFGRVYAGEDEKSCVLVEVDRDPAASYAEFPPDLNCPWSVTTAVPNLIRSSLSLMGDAADIVTGLRLRGYPAGRDLGALPRMAGMAGSYIRHMLPGMLLPSFGQRRSPGDDPDGARVSLAGTVELNKPPLNARTINLKQFRDAEDPNLACYKALVESDMGVDRFNGGGLLGDWDLLRGDPSGGYTVRIYRYTAQPIMELLGIAVDDTEPNPSEGSVAILKPSFPFWSDVDLYYGAGQVLCSKARKGPWFNEFNPTDALHDGARLIPADIVYNDTLGAATQPVVGPFHFPDVTVQVYPLLADQARLNDFVDGYLNKLFKPPRDGKPKMKFETMGAYAYLIVNVIGDKRGTMWSSNNNIGWWAEREVSFCIPVKWYDEHDKLISLAMIEPFVYANKDRAVITDREVNGRNSVVATIDSPNDVWMSPDGPASERRLLHVATQIFPALNLGQRAEERKLIEIDQCDVLPPEDKEGWRGIAATWGRFLVDDLKRKTWLASAQSRQLEDAKALALEILAHGAPMNRITLKQYRDADEVDHACYQALVHTQRAITRVYDIREIQDRVHVRLHQVAGHPIAQVLGLKIKSVHSAAGNVVDILQPIRPFWMHIAMKEELGSIIGTVDPAIGQDSSNEKRYGRNRVWKFSHPWFGGDRLEADGETARRPAGGPYFLADQDTRVGRSLGAHDWLGSRDRGGNNPYIDLKDHATKWLRNSWTNELAWIKVNVKQDSWTDSDLDKIKRKLEKIKQERKETWSPTARFDPEMFTQFLKMEASSINDFCDALSIENMVALARAAALADLAPARPSAAEAASSSQAGGGLPAQAGTLMEDLEKMGDVLKQNYDPSSQSVKEILDGLLTKDKNDFETWANSPGLWDERFRGLPERSRLAWIKRLPASMSEEISKVLTKHPPTPVHSGPFMEFPVVTVSDENLFAEIAKLIEMLHVYDDWKDPSRWQRLTPKAAGESIRKLEEVQVVLESILSCAWENRDEKTLRDSEPEDSKLEHRIPTGSVGSEGDEWFEKQGLCKWEDGDGDKRWWIVPAQ